MREDYGDLYRELYLRHWWWWAREKLIIKTLRARRPAAGWKNILDVGCGDGLFFDPLMQFGEVEGVEPSAALINPYGAHRSRIHVCPFDATFRPGKQFALILMLDVLEHLPDPAAALKHALSLLAPQGTLLITLPAFRWLWTNHDVINQHFTRYSRNTFRQVARQASWQPEGERYFFQWLVPLKIATRVAERFSDRPPEPAGIPPKWINTICYLLSRLEQQTWGVLPWPFGTSLMVWGGKPAA